MEEKLNSPLGHTEAMIAGALAGWAVDLSLFPLDTIKTRLQSHQGFAAAGGFRRIYAGVPAITVGSAPSAALFFVSYEKSKRIFDRVFPHPTYAHMTSACVGELVACLIRVPTEVFKQRAQAAPKLSVLRLVHHTLLNDGISGCYRGYWSTISRELPFSFIEFPLWEYLKKFWSREQARPVTALQTAACGSVSGAVAAGLTTPLDVAKTRIMLSRKVVGERMTVKSVLADIYRAKGLRGLFAGFWPRVAWMALGGFVFFGAYDKSVRFVNAFEPVDTPERAQWLAYCHWYSGMIMKFYDAILEPDKAESERTFDDALRDSAETEERRRAFIAATKTKLENKGHV